ncbi:hypothetical protein [Ferruginibacter sp.]
MRYLVLPLLIAVFITSCSSSKKMASSSSSGSTTTATAGAADADGSSFDKAIFINEKTEGPGVDAEYKWLKKNYPGYKVKSQSLSNHNGKPYDILTIETASGKTEKVYFDISKFFGKM